MKKLLIGSSICQSPKILNLFLKSINNLNLSEFETHYYIIDDNQNPESSEILKNFQPPNLTLKQAETRQATYHTDEKTHYWNNALVMRVANAKNQIIDYAKQNDFDYLFFVDSDLLFDADLISHLAKQEKDIVSTIFWTAWQPNTVALPNVWLFDRYEMVHPSFDEATRRTKSFEFLNMLKQPGIYDVGGLGACTLISKKALNAGVNFSPIKNLSIWGEDRWFCIRALALGLDLFVDTHHPATHLYRESDIQEDVILRHLGHIDNILEDIEI